MKKRTVSLAAALALLLAGCGEITEPTVTPTSAPNVEVTATPAPTAAPEPSEEVKELWGFPIDDTHDAFEVPTGGALGTVLVTVEMGEQNEDELGGYHHTISVWDKSDLKTPIQTWETTMPIFNCHDLADANFDGYTDFLYTWDRIAINWPVSLYVWDEEQGEFVFEIDFMGRGVGVDEETQTLHNSVHYTNYSGAHEIYRWEDGELVCFRVEETSGPTGDLQIVETVIYERVDGELVEVSRDSYAMQGL